MRFAIALVLMLAAGMAMAGETHRFAKGVVTVGDGTGAVMQRAGKPDRVVQLENGFGAAMGERWEYYQGGKTVILTFRGGVVVSIEEVL
jgi:hypothetical protein